MSNGDKNCTTCRYFHPHEPSPPEFPGECRRFPPMPTATTSNCRYVTVDQNEWCGEYLRAVPE